MKVKENIVFAGYGISAPDKGIDEYANVDVKGKVVLVFKGNPLDYNPPRSWFAPEAKDTGKEKPDLKAESADSAKIMTAMEKGASAVMLYSLEKEEGRGMFQRPSRPPLDTPFNPGFAVLHDVSEPVFHWILREDPQMSTRGFNTWLSAVRSDIKAGVSRSFETNARAEITTFKKTLLRGKRFNNHFGRNVIAKITGSDEKLKNEYVIIGAHFDHVGVTNEQVYNGAEDNASGSAVVMEVARLMKAHDIQPARTVVFCLWTGEELGLIGSRHYVDQPADGVTMDRVAAYFNMDMVGVGDTISAPGALNFPEIWDVISAHQDPDVMAVVKPRTGGPGGSDHSGFIQLGIESLALMTGGDGGHPDYHDTGDDTEKLNPEIMEKTARFVLQGVVNLADERGKTLILSDRQEQYDAMRWNVTVIDAALGVEDGWSRMEIADASDLSQKMVEKAEALRESGPERMDMRAMMRRRYGYTAYHQGIEGGHVFHYEPCLIPIAADLLSFGRIDFTADDGIWFKEGVTPQGEKALSALEKAGVAIHLRSPSEGTLQGLLDKAEKPFLVSGFTTDDDSLLARISEKALVAVAFDPADIEGTVARLNGWKERLGGCRNLILDVRSGENLEKASRELYRGLLKAGWTKTEIYGIGGQGESYRSRGNLDFLTGRGGRRTTSPHS